MLSSPAAALSLLAALASAPVPSDPSPTYAIHALRVGSMPKANRVLFIVDETLGPSIEIAFTFWVLRGNGRVILIDAGFIAERVPRGWPVKDHRDPAQALAALGVQPKQVTDIILTHAHWDHVGGLVRFPHATFWMSPNTAATARRMGQRQDKALGQILKAADQAGRLRLTEDSQTVAPGITVRHLGQHTPGFQAVVVRNPDGPWVLASDIGPLRANFLRDRPTGQAKNRRRAREALEIIRDLAGQKIHRIVPGHEPSGFDSRGISVIYAPTP